MKLEKGKLYYLASPYTHKIPKIMSIRYKQVSQMAARLLAQGFDVMCPIAHSWAIVSCGYGYIEDMDHDTWMRVDINIVKRCDAVLVLTLDGWEDSRGVTEEIQYAKDHHIELLFINEAGEVHDGDVKKASKVVTDMREEDGEI